MRKKSSKKRTEMTAWRRAVFISSACMLLGGAFAYYLYRTTLCRPLQLLAVIQIMPAVINLVLTLPFGRAEKVPIEKKEGEEPLKAAMPPASDEVVKLASEPVPDEDAAPAGEPVSKKATAAPPKGKKPHPVREKGKSFLSRVAHTLARFYGRFRSAILTAVIVVITLSLNLYFWSATKAVGDGFYVSWAVPVSLFLIWIAFVVLEKYCKHLSDNMKEEGDEAAARQNTYDRALVQSMRGALTLAALSHLVFGVVLVVHLSGSLNLVKAGGVILSVVFAYMTVTMMISLFVRNVRKEMGKSPELDIPVPGIGGEDLSVIAYLENNTGITMRSLWSIKLMKKVVPVAVFSIVVLLWGFSGVVKVEAYQQGAHYRLGKLQEEVLTPGLHVTLPWPFDQVEIYDTETVNKMTIGFLDEDCADNLWTGQHSGEEYKLLLGGGKELVSINLRVEYKISDLKSYVRNSASPARIMEAAAYEAITERTICTDLETLLSSDRQALSASLKEDLTARSARYNTGLEVVSVVLESIHPPIEIANVYQQIISAEIRAQQVILQAEGEASVRVTNAQQSYDFTVKKQQELYYEAIAKAKSEVSDFMASVEAETECGEDAYRYYKYLKALSDAYSKGTVVIVGEGINQGHIYIGGPKK